MTLVLCFLIIIAFFCLFLTLLWKDKAGKPYPFPRKASFCLSASVMPRTLLFKNHYSNGQTDAYKGFLSLQFPYSVSHRVSCLASLCCWAVHGRAKQEITASEVPVPSFCIQTGRYDGIHAERLRAGDCLWPRFPALSMPLETGMEMPTLVSSQLFSQGSSRTRWAPLARCFCQHFVQ